MFKSFIEFICKGKTVVLSVLIPQLMFLMMLYDAGNKVPVITYSVYKVVFLGMNFLLMIFVIRDNFR